MGVDTIFFCGREEELPLYLDVGWKIIYLLILIAMLIFALRKCKRNGGRRQTTLRFNGAASDDDSDACSGQIAVSSTFLFVTTTMP